MASIKVTGHKPGTGKPSSGSNSGSKKPTTSTKKTPTTTKKTPTTTKKTPSTTKKNPTTDKKVSATETTKTVVEPVVYESPSSVNFDSNAWKQAYIDQMVSELTSNYNTDKANLDKTFNTNITNYTNQLKDTDMSYDANIQQLQRQKYQDEQQAKNESFSRGLGFGGLGQAIEQTARNNANNKIADTQNERTMAINNINTLINQAKYNYGVDSDTLLKNFNADKLKYMSTAEIQALEKQLAVDIHNNDWANKFLQSANDRIFTSTENDKKYQWQSKENLLDRELTASEAQKDRDAKTALEKLQASLGKYNSYSSGSGSNSSSSPNSTLAANYLEDAGVSTNSTANAYFWDYVSGNISFNEFRAKVDALAKNGSGAGGGGSANKGSGSGRRTSSGNSLFSRLLETSSGSIPDKKGLNSSSHRPSANKKSGSGRRR